MKKIILVIVLLPIEYSIFLKRLTLGQGLFFKKVIKNEHN